MTLTAGVVAALVGLALSAVLISWARGRASDYEQNETAAAALHAVHLVKRNRLPPALPPDGAQAVQVLNEHGVVVAATTNMRGLPPMANFRPGEDSVFAIRDIPRPAGLDGPMRVVGFRVYQPGGDWMIYAADRVVPWYVNGVVCWLLFWSTVLVSMLVAVRTWRTVDQTLAPVDAIRAELAEITATESGRRVPVPRSRDEIRLLAETANATLDRLDAALERQRRFTSEASHDLRHPITAARAHLEEALLYPEEADWPRVGRCVLDSLGKLQAIVADLLELARLDASPPVIGGATVDLAALVKAELGQRLEDEKRIVPRLEPGVRVRGDALRLSRLLANLLDNAERHASAEVAVTVRRDGEFAIMEVADDGDGIAPADRDLVFQRFARLRAGRDADAGGTGLGLPIAREIATIHHGTLTIEDSVRGACFVLRLPRAHSSGC